MFATYIFIFNYVFSFKDFVVRWNEELAPVILILKIKNKMKFGVFNLRWLIFK